MTTVETMVAGLKEALKHEFDNKPWLRGGARRAALMKLSKMTADVGQQAELKDASVLDRHFAAVVVADGEFFSSYLGALKEMQRKRLHEPLQPIFAFGESHTRNVRHYNRLFVSASGLRPPFFDQGATASRNYGSLGLVSSFVSLLFFFVG